jgi:hypothetical protein
MQEKVRFTGRNLANQVVTRFEYPSTSNTRPRVKSDWRQQDEQ